jgi:hypothetical protein
MTSPTTVPITRNPIPPLFVPGIGSIVALRAIGPSCLLGLRTLSLRASEFVGAEESNIR